MRVLHVVHWPRSGIGVVVRDIVRFASAPFKHTVLCLQPGEPVTSEIQSAGAEVIALDCGKNPWPEYIRSLRRAIQSFDVDLIHSHSLTPRMLALIAGGRTPQITTVHTAYHYFTSRTILSWLKRRIECAMAIRSIPSYVCVSPEVARSLPCSGMLNKATVVINGVDSERARANMTEPLELSPYGNPLLVAVGRLEWEKGFATLLGAVAEVRGDYLPDLGVIICGDGSERRVLEARAKSLGIESAVHFTGHVQNPIQYVAAADAFISSSVQEGFAITVLEAFAVGVPAILTPTSGVASLVRNDIEAFVAGGFSQADVASAICRAFADRKLLKEVAAAGQELAAQRFDIRRTVREYETLYNEVLRKHRTV